MPIYVDGQLRPGVNQIPPISITGAVCGQSRVKPPLTILDQVQHKCSFFALNSFVICL